MAGDPHSDEWRFGAEPAHPQNSEANAASAPALEAAARLDRPIATLTVEHLAWAIVIAWTIFTRLVALGHRPLDAREASCAITSLEVAHQGLADAVEAALITWVRIAGAIAFQIFGASDSSSRLISALAGIAMVGAAFAMRDRLGRAGALALAAMFALSPTLTYVARSSTDIASALAAAMLAIAATSILFDRASLLWAIALAAFAALAVTGASVMYAFAAPAVAMLALAVIPRLVVDHPILRVKVWWERRRAFVLAAVVVFAIVWFFAATAMQTYEVVSPWLENFRRFARPSGWSLAAGAQFYLPIFGFYEFEIVLLAIASLGAILFGRHRGVAMFAIAWAIATTVMMMAMPVRRADFVAAMLIPLCVSGAVGVDAIATTPVWRYARVAIAALGILTLNTQLRTNFAYDAANASAPEWNQHPLLFWSDPATAAQARSEFRRAISSMPDDAARTADFPAGEAVLEWYFRDVPTPDESATAAIDVETSESAATKSSDANTFGYQVAWMPDLAGTSAKDLVTYFLTMRAWNAFQIRDAELSVIAPESAASPAAQPIATPSPTQTPTSTSTATPLPSK